MHKIPDRNQLKKMRNLKVLCVLQLPQLEVITKSLILCSPGLHLLAKLLVLCKLSLALFQQSLVLILIQKVGFVQGFSRKTTIFFIRYQFSLFPANNQKLIYTDWIFVRFFSQK